LWTLLNERRTGKEAAEQPGEPAGPARGLPGALVLLCHKRLASAALL